nr:hypothetical protein [Bacillus cereus]
MLTVAISNKETPPAIGPTWLKEKGHSDKAPIKLVCQKCPKATDSVPLDPVTPVGPVAPVEPVG